MKKIIFLLFFVFCLSSILAQVKAKVGVIPTTGNVDEGTKDAITNALIAGIYNSPGLRPIERSQFDKILKEKELHLSDFMDEESIIENGHLLGVKYLCLSSVNQVKHNYIIDYRLVDVETGEIKEKEREMATETNITDVIIALSDKKLFSEQKTTNPRFCGLEIQKEDLKGTEYCPQGWRLPSIKDLKCMYENRKEIGNFLYGEYLSREKRDGFPLGIRFNTGEQTNILGRASIRCVKDL